MVKQIYLGLIFTLFFSTTSLAMDPPPGPNLNDLLAALQNFTEVLRELNQNGIDWREAVKPMIPAATKFLYDSPGAFQAASDDFSQMILVAAITFSICMVISSVACAIPKIYQTRSKNREYRRLRTIEDGHIQTYAEQ